MVRCGNAEFGSTAAAAGVSFIACGSGAHLYSLHHCILQQQSFMATRVLAVLTEVLLPFAACVQSA